MTAFAGDFRRLHGMISREKLIAADDNMAADQAFGTYHSVSPCDCIAEEKS